MLHMIVVISHVIQSHSVTWTILLQKLQSQTVKGWNRGKDVVTKQRLYLIHCYRLA